jgi:hypothetical protein
MASKSKTAIKTRRGKTKMKTKTKIKGPRGRTAIGVRKTKKPKK